MAFVLQNSRYREVITNFAREQGYRSNVTRDEMESILKQCKDAKLIPRGARTASLLNCWVEDEEEEEEVESPKRQRDEEDEEDDVSRVVLMCAAVYPMAKSEGNLKLARKCYERAADLLESYFDKQNAEDDEDEDFIGSDEHQVEEEEEEEEAKPLRITVEPMFVTVGTRFNMLHPGVDAQDRLIEVGAKALRYYIDTYNEMPKKKRGSGSYNYPLSRCAETVDRAIREVMQD